MRIAERRREGAWPRVYRIRRGQRVFLGGIALLVLAGGLLATGTILLGWWEAHPALALVPVALAGLGGYLLAAVEAERLVLHEDALELVELGKGRRRVRREEIAGRRIVPLQYGYHQLVLELRGGRKPLRIHWMHESDPVLQAWIDGFPDLDAEERTRGEAELLRSAELGSSEVERAGSLERERRVARALNGISIAVSLWALFYPRPYLVALAAVAVLPLVGLAVLLGGRGRYAFEGRRNDPRPWLGTTILGAGLVLGLRAILDVNVLDWKPLLLAAALCAVAQVVVIALGERPRAPKLWVLAAVAPLVAFHPWGALTLGNALLDRGQPELFQAEVRAKSVSSGKRTSWKLQLAPWGPVAEPADVDVGRRLYDAVEVGDRVCVALHPGALGARWYVVLRCPDGGRGP